MYTKITKTDTDYTEETYQSWYNVLFEGWMISGIYFLTGLIGLFVTPFMAVRSLWQPQCTGSHGHHDSSGIKYDPRTGKPCQSTNHETPPFESSENLT